MLRLTLRTLLAYLDDTLDPAQTKQIGAKVAESDEAKATVERIKSVTRRRRLTALPVDTPDSTTDPNTIAEYLDSTLSSDQQVEVEQTALDNDTMLAEVAACHQILTLVLGEPAKVPATASMRMYRLVKGPESIPYRKPQNESPVTITPPPNVNEEPFEDELLGTFLGPRKLFWFVGCVVLVLLAAIAIWLALPPALAPVQQGYVSIPMTTNQPAAPKTPTVVTPKPPEVVTKKEPTVVEPSTPELGPPPRVVPVVELPVIPKRPDQQRDTVATLDDMSQPLLIRKRDTQRWERVNVAMPKLHSTDSYLALPGFHPTLTTDSGVKLQLWGNVNEFLNIAISETVITPYIPPVGIDAEFTLHTGRVFINAPNATKPVVIRIRFLEEVWDISLTDKTTEIVLDRLGEPAPVEAFQGVGESPRILVYLGVLQGTASVRDGPHVSGPLVANTKFKFDSKAGRPAIAPKNDADEPAVVDRWSRQFPNTRDANQMLEAVKGLRDLVARNGLTDEDLFAYAKEPQERIPVRVLATHMLGALGSLSKLIDAVELDPLPVREAATRTLTLWVAQEAGRLDEFSTALSNKATYTADQRSAITALIQAGSKPSLDNAEKVFALLKNDRLAVREFAKAHLLQYDPNGAKDFGYDTSLVAEVRNPRANSWLAAWKKREMKAKE